MSREQLRREVLRCYKVVMRTRQKVFAGDTEALHLTRVKAREEFDKNRNVSDPEQIKECLQVGFDSAEILRKTVIQARLNERGNYEMKIDQHNLDG